MSKKKRNTFAARSSEANKVSQSSYTLPATHQIFVPELQEACQQGDLCLKKAIEELAPQMATTLKDEKGGIYWENTDVPLVDVPPE